ncbi:MAG: hypothetical protein LUH14_07330 [Clostridiaceae bacterium]|nr:hypothetical protein [Clostridiaceae bacterium]
MNGNSSQGYHVAVSRSDKVREAKAAFGTASGGGRSFPEGSTAQNQKKYRKEKEIPFGMIRMLAAGVLFLMLLLFCHYDVSYHGMERSSIENALSDDSHWQELVHQARQVMKQIK